MVNLSYSTVNMLYESSHNWINKQLGRQVPDYPYFQEGKRIHRLIQDHVAGIKPDKRFEGIGYTFPVVERVDFDPECRFEVQLTNEYNLIGYTDGRNYDTKQYLEIKSANKHWTINDYIKTMQRKCYALGLPEMETGVLVSYNKQDESIKVYTVPLTERDREQAREWLMGAIEIIERGDFTGGLDEDGVCRNYRCLYGDNCYFKKVRY